MSADIGALFDERDSLEIARLVKAGEVSASELAEEAIRRIEALNPVLNAVSIPLYDYGRRAAADPALPDGPFKGRALPAQGPRHALGGHPAGQQLPLLQRLRFAPPT